MNRDQKTSDQAQASSTAAKLPAFAFPAKARNDKRTDLRVPTSLNAVLNYDAHAVMCTVRDISMGGAFVEADPTELPLTRSVELGMSVETESGTKHYRVPVLIRHITNEGAGISFGELNGNDYFDLVDIVYRA